MNREAQTESSESRKMVTHGVSRGLAGVFASSPGGAKEKFVIYTRPHPGPLPRGEGEATRVFAKFDRHGCNRRLFVIRLKTHTTTRDVRFANNRRTILPLLGERAGVRASVTTNFPPSFRGFCK
jgi:hypothetical protein